MAELDEGEALRKLEEKASEQQMQQEPEALQDKLVFYANIYLNKVLGPIKKNIVPIAVAAIVIVALLWFFVLRPQPGTLSITLRQLDSENLLSSATVSLRAGDGMELQTSISDDSGVVIFNGVPTEKDLSISVTPAEPELNTVSSSVRLLSRESKSIIVQVDRRTGLQIESPSIDFTTAPGCFKKVKLEVLNAGENDEQVQLVASDSIAKYVKVNGGVQTVAATERKTFTVTVSAAEGDLKGEIRIKGTKKGVSVKVSAKGVKPKLGVEFDIGAAKGFRAGFNALPFTRKSQVSIQNKGAKNSIALSDVSVRVSGDVKDWVTLDLETLQEKKEILPDDEALFGFTITVPAGTLVSPYTGQLIVETNCETKQIPLNAEVE